MNVMESGRLTDPMPIRWLAVPGSEAWVAQAQAYPRDLLVDHADYERKAVPYCMTAQGRLSGGVPGLVEAPSPLTGDH